MGASSFFVSGLYFAGLALLFVGERLIATGLTRTILSGGGLLLVLGAVGVRLMRRGEQARKTNSARAAVEKWILALYAVGVASLALYFINSDLFASIASSELSKSSPKLSASLSALWPALMLATLAPLLLVELAYDAMAQAPQIESGRVKDALFSGLGLAGALVFSFSIYYVSSERDHKVDFSFFRTAKPGEATRKIVRTLDQPLSISLFFPPSNEVREEVQSYVKDLAGESKLLEVNVYDHAVDPTKAKDLGVSGNGIIAIHREKRKELLSIGLELESARNQLRNLDKEIQKRLLQVGKPQRTLYLTSGHGERASFPGGDTDKRLSIRDLRDQVLQAQGYVLKDFGAGEGLATEIPADAAVVAIIGPQKPFLAEEIAALTRYWERGGRVFVALDPENGLDWAELLKPFGVAFSPVTLCNEQVLVRRTFQAIDKTNLVTGSYSSHPSVTTLGRMGMRAPMVLVGAGALSERKDKAKELSIDFTLRAQPQTFNDKNGNLSFDGAPGGDEQKKAWELAAAVQRKTNAQKPESDGRAVIIGDSDVLCDGVIGAYGNPYFIVDGIKWLLGDEAIAGETTSEVDVPITHTKRQDLGWYYGTVILAPALMLGIGIRVNRRRKPVSKEKK